MRRAWVVTVLSGSLAACGGGGSSPSSSTPAAPVVPASAIQASGNGALVVHPSAVSPWVWALYVPVRITETAGGTAKWNYARLSLLSDGVEVERSEIGADILAQPPDWTNITARQNSAYALAFRFQSDVGVDDEEESGIDDMRFELGFSDKKDGRQFAVFVTEGFTGPDISLEPLSRSAPHVHGIE